MTPEDEARHVARLAISGGAVDDLLVAYMDPSEPPSSWWDKFVPVALERLSLMANAPLEYQDVRVEMDARLNLVTS